MENITIENSNINTNIELAISPSQLKGPKPGTGKIEAIITNARK
jgi:hypothetical protein